jgi:hypothetical protein
MLLRRLCHLPGAVLRALCAAMNAAPSRIVIPDSCRSNFQPFYLHPPDALLSLRSLSSRSSGRELPHSLPGSASVLGFATPSHARQCIWPYRVHHFLNYGLVVRFRLPSTPPLDDALAFSYGQPVLCPTGTFTPLLVPTLRRTRAAFAGRRNESNSATAALASDRRNEDRRRDTEARDS